MRTIPEKYSTIAVIKLTLGEEISRKEAVLFPRHGERKSVPDIAAVRRSPLS
jgi:hypothetical protein